MNNFTRGFTVLIAAAGSGRRFGGDKLLLDLAGRSVLQRSIDLFASSHDVKRVILSRNVAVSDPAGPAVTSPAGMIQYPFDVIHVSGGHTRAHSVLLALHKLAEIDPTCEFVAVHDAARPLTPLAVVDRVFAAAIKFGAAIPGIAVTDTIKQFDPATNRIIATPPRATLTAVQTPQAMRLDWLLDAYSRVSDAELEAVTDEASLLERAGYPVHLVEGSPDNLKITTPADLARAQSIIAPTTPTTPTTPPRVA